MFDYLERQLQVLDFQRELFSLRSKFIQERNYLRGIDLQALTESERFILERRISRNRLALKQIVALNDKIIRRMLSG